MTCDRCRDNFTDLLDGALTPQRRESVEAHMQACAACSAEWRAFGSAVAAVRELPQADPDPRLLVRLSAALARSGS